MSSPCHRKALVSSSLPNSGIDPGLIQLIKDSGPADLERYQEGAREYHVYLRKRPKGGHLYRVKENPVQIPDVIQRAIPDIVRVAQAQYDSWQQDENGYDEEVGSGGICHLIADDIVGVLSDQSLVCTTVSAHDEVHVYVVLQHTTGVWLVDIRPYVYERGDGYTWTKIPDVEFSESDITIDRLSPFSEDFDQYVGD